MRENRWKRRNHWRMNNGRAGSVETGGLGKHVEEFKYVNMWKSLSR